MPLSIKKLKAHELRLKLPQSFTPSTNYSTEQKLKEKKCVENLTQVFSAIRKESCGFEAHSVWM
jgi:hypothetical protein